MLDICSSCWYAINGLDEDVNGVLDTLEGVIIANDVDEGWHVFYCDACHNVRNSPLYHGEYL